MRACYLRGDGGCQAGAAGPRCRRVCRPAGLVRGSIAAAAARRRPRRTYEVRPGLRPAAVIRALRPVSR
jgi:hypothetical protein